MAIGRFDRKNEDRDQGKRKRGGKGKRRKWKLKSSLRPTHYVVIPFKMASRDGDAIYPGETKSVTERRFRSGNRRKFDEGTPRPELRWINRRLWYDYATRPSSTSSSSSNSLSRWKLISTGPLWRKTGFHQRETRFLDYGIRWDVLDFPKFSFFFFF